MKIGITGHRPQKLNREWDYDGPVTQALREKFHWAFDTRNPHLVISGMAQGTDLIAAEVALDLGIPVVAAIPFHEQPDRWTKKAQQRYLGILEHELVTSVYVDVELDREDAHYATKMQLRNEWIVDHSDVMIAVWDKQRDGGTFNCLCYAKKRRRRVWIIDPRQFYPQPELALDE